MSELDRYISSVLKDTGVGLIVASIVGLFLSHKALKASLVVFITGLIFLGLGLIYTKIKSNI
jgi:uncharacterized membrane protein (Fun14 family)